jgi:hypothetical protein
MAIYQEMMEDHCGFCARPALFVRVVSAVSPWLYNVAGSWLAGTCWHAWMSGASVLIPWECLECGCRLSDQAGTKRQPMSSLDSPTLPVAQVAPLHERPVAR